MIQTLQKKKEKKKMIQICLISRTAEQTHTVSDKWQVLLYVSYTVIPDRTVTKRLHISNPLHSICYNQKINKNCWEPLESSVQRWKRERNLVEITNLHSRLVCHFQQMTFHFQQMTVILHLYFSITVLPCGVYQESKVVFRGKNNNKATKSRAIYYHKT